MYKKRTALLLTASLLMTAVPNYAEEDLTAEPVVQVEITTEDPNAFVGEPIQLTLEEATAYMLSESPGYKTAVLNYEDAQATIKGYDYSVDNFETLGLNYDNYVSFNYSSSLSKDLAEISLAYAESQIEPNYEAELNSLKYDLREKYFTVQQLEETLRIQEDSLAIQEKTLSETTEKYNLGLVTLNDLHTAEASVMSAEDSLQSTENGLALAKMDLNNHLGYDLLQALELTDTLEMLELPETDLATSIETAIDLSNTVNVTEYGLEIAERNFAAADVRYSSRSSSYLSAKVDLREAEEALSTVKTGIEIDARSKYMTMMLEYQEIATAEKEVANAKEQMEAAELSYELGLGTLLTTQQAQLAYTSAQMSLAQAILDYNLAVDQYNSLMTPGSTTATIS